ncbi:ice-binding family protein [Spirosoma areae]
MKNIALFILLASSQLASPTVGFGQAPNLGTTASFAVFTAAGAFSNDGATVISGNIGTHVGALTGFPPGTVIGETHVANATSAQAATDVDVAYGSLTGVTCGSVIGTTLGNNQVLTPNVYCTGAASTLTGNLTLDGQNNPNALFIIKIGGPLSTAALSTISLINGASCSNVYFQVNGAVILETNSVFKGTILANGAISLLEGASLEGRALSRGGAISLHNNVVSATTLSLGVVTAGACSPATNLFSISGTFSLTNAAVGIATLTDGTSTATVSVSAGNTSVPYSLTGLISGTGTHTVTAGYGCKIFSVTYTAPASCTVSLGGLVFSDNNNDGLRNGGDTPIPGVTVTLLDGANAPITSTTTNASGLYSFSGLTSALPYSVSYTTPTGYSATAPSLTGPLTLTSGENTTPDVGFLPLVNSLLSVQSFVDRSIARVGDLLTYAVVVTNAGSTSASTTVRDSVSAGLTYVPGSAAVPAGTSFTVGQPLSLWDIPVIAPGQSLTLTFQVRVDSTGILYNTATIPGDTVKVCTSIPVKLCVGDEYTLTAPVGRTVYSWYKDNVLIAGQTTNVLVVTAPGTYSLGVDNAGGLCANFSCCPFIVEEDTLPVFQAVAIAATCQGNSPQSNGRLVLTNFNLGHTYQYSLGSTFNPAASLSGAPQAIPSNGVIVSTLANPAVVQSYTVRVINSSGCYTDMAVILIPTVCGCPVDVCVPYVIAQTNRPKRIGDLIR